MILCGSWHVGGESCELLSALSKRRRWARLVEVTRPHLISVAGVPSGIRLNKSRNQYKRMGAGRPRSPGYTLPRNPNPPARCIEPPRAFPSGRGLMPLAALSGGASQRGVAVLFFLPLPLITADPTAQQLGHSNAAAELQPRVARTFSRRSCTRTSGSCRRRSTTTQCSLPTHHTCETAVWSATEASDPPSESGWARPTRSG
jgi:hypothetical protein